jgi:acyl carrier protein
MHSVLDIKQFIIEEFLPDSDASRLGDDLDLIQSGIVDSLGVLKIVAAIENELGVSIEPELLDAENYRTTAAIESLIRSRLLADVA